jgi:hypothetical protein
MKALVAAFVAVSLSVPCAEQVSARGCEVQANQAALG